MARRRRYDTEALVGQLRAERRAGILLSLAGIGILLFLVVLYVTGIGDDEDIPKVPAEESTAAKLATEAAVADAAAADAGAAGSPTEPPAAGDGAVAADAAPEEPAPAGPVQVSLSLSKKGVVWVDKKKLGKFKKKQLELPPGVHTIKAKVGRKTVKSKIEIKSGENVTVVIDHKKKKITVKPKK